MWEYTDVSFAIGAFTVTSFDVSRVRLESLVGKRFVVVWLCVYFAGIQSLFAFISLTHKIMILFCIGAGYIGHCVDGSLYFVTIKKKEKRRKIRLNAFSCKQWGRRSLKKLSTVLCTNCRHFTSPTFYCNTYQHILHCRMYNKLPNRLYLMLQIE